MGDPVEVKRQLSGQDGLDRRMRVPSTGSSLLMAPLIIGDVGEAV